MNRLRELLRRPTLDHLLTDLRYALRGMRRAPGFYTTAVLMLALVSGSMRLFSASSLVRTPVRHRTRML